MLIGGYPPNGPTSPTDDVDLISLDPAKYPVPAQLKNLRKFPRKMSCGTDALVNSGMLI
jgi:hypothetical protein